MKRLLLSLAISTASVFIAPSAFAGPGESDGNTANDCNTSSGACLVTPTKFSTKVYRVLLCTSNPMASPATSPDWSGNGCVDVYNSSSGEETGDIFGATGATLSSQYITLPTAGSYTHIAALLDVNFKAGSHHMVYAAGGDPINNKRYYSTSSGGAAEGTASQVEMMSGSFQTLAPQIACTSAYTAANSADRTGLEGNGFQGRLLDSSFEMTTTGSGSINNQTAICNNVKYLLSIVQRNTTIDSSTNGIHLKILADKGVVRADQGSNDDGVISAFTTHGHSITVDVAPITSSN